MKKITLAAFVAVLAFVVSCTYEEVNNQPDTEAIDIIDQDKPLNIEQINSAIQEQLDTKGVFDWTMASDHLLWSATQHSNNLLTVGYGINGESFSTSKGQALENIKTEILNTILKNSTAKSTEDILIYDDDILNYIDVTVTTLESIAELRKNKQIRYLEPEGYRFFTQDQNQETGRSSAGCSQAGVNIPIADYGTNGNGAKIPWNYYDHKINQAWAYSTGRGIGVGVIDTGLSPNQPLLGSRFDDFYSGRYVQKYGTYVDSFWWWSTKTDGPNDRCGHGTSASGVIAAPNNNTGDFIGVAYESNLISYRGTSDVVLEGYHERKGVANALKALARRSDVKIISMSIGYPWSIGRIKDAVRYAYSRGKMIFAAGGTSTNFTNWYGVIFPATMSETVAVTGVEERATYDRCDICHDGSKIDFTIIMERSNNNHQPVIGFNNGESSSFGGSSTATATTAGIAALVWAKNPSWNRSQVLQRLKESGDFYPNRSSRYGYGNIDALKAVRGY